MYDLRMMISVCFYHRSAGPPNSSEDAQAQPQPQPPTNDPPDQQLKGPSASNGHGNGNNGLGEAHQEPPLERGQGGKSQQTGSVAQGLLVSGEAAGASASSTAGLVANGAADLLQASREEHVRQIRAHAVDYIVSGPGPLMS